LLRFTKLAIDSGAGTGKLRAFFMTFTPKVGSTIVIVVIKTVVLCVIL
jgi:hypothetical protein